MMKLFKHIFNGLSISLLVACFGAWLFFGWSGTGWKALAIPTGSMRPALPPGSMVFVHRVPVSSLKVGDVITYTNPRNPKMTISHRIVNTYLIGGKVPGFVTKGDANPNEDVPIPAGLIKGKVVWHVPYAGFGLMKAKNPWVILPIIYIAALLIMIEEVGRLAEYYRRFVVYRFPGYTRKLELERANIVAKRVSMGAALTSAFVIIGLATGPTAFAALHSNTVSLVHNRLTVAKIKPPKPPKCHGNNNVTVNNSTTQNATTGNAHSSGSGNATSGNASNTNNTNININISNC